MRLRASITASWLILASGSVFVAVPGTPGAPAIRERAPAPLACTLVALPGNAFTFVRPPEAALRQFLAGQAATATFQVTYVGFESFPAAQAAFQAAVDIWSALVESPVPIKVRAEFRPLGANILGSAGAQFYWRDFPGAPLADTWWIDALADRVSGGDLNAASPGAFDILANFNSSFGNWHFGTSGGTPAGQYDFMTVVLHELGHGLGVTGAASVSGGVGTIGFSGFPTAYDRFVVTETDAPILGFANPSAALGTQLTSGFSGANPRGPGVYWGGPLGRQANGGLSARLYTPSTWSPGSSYSHLDENTYPVGHPSSLMTYAIAQAEAIHDPGPVTLGLLGDSGWVLPGGLVKTAADPAVHWVQNGRRYPVASPAVITEMQNGGVMGWNASAIATVPVLPGLAAPAFIAPDAGSNGLLIRPFTAPDVFVVQNGLRRTVMSPEALAWNGVAWLPDVIDISTGAMAAFTTGTGMNIHAIGDGEMPPVKQSFAAAYARLMAAGTCGTTTWTGWPGAFATCLEFPQGAVLPALPSGVSHLTGKFQNYGNATARLGVLQHSTLGTFGVWGGILTKWQELGASASALGLPTSDEYEWGTLRRSDFEGGYITWNGSTATVVFNTSVPTPFSKTSPANGAVAQPAALTLSWATSTGATGYEYCLDATANASCDATWIGVGAATTAGITGLVLGTIHEWQVRALSSAGAAPADSGDWWSFTTTAATRILDLSGSLSFGQTIVGQTPARTLAIGNTGNSALTVTGISYPPGFSGNWAGGVIAPGGVQPVTVTFAPTAAAAYGGTVTVTADQTAGTPTVSASGTGALRGVTDIDGDGVGDILLQNESTTVVAAWLMNASGQPASATTVYGDNIQGWTVVGRADLNADGIGDVLLQDSNTTFIAAWLMNAGGQPASFIYVYPGNVGNWKVVGTADLNADGVADILLQDPVTTYVAALRLNGTGQPTSFVPVYFDHINGWRVVATMDLNQDDITDIVLQDSATSHVGAWLMNAAGQPVSFVPVYFGTTGNWRVAGAEDLNGDGTLDILLQDAVTTHAAVWLMNTSGQPVTFIVFYPGGIDAWRIKGRR